MLAWRTTFPRFRVSAFPRFRVSAFPRFRVSAFRFKPQGGYLIPHYLAKTAALKLLNSKNGENLELLFGNEAGVYGLL